MSAVARQIVTFRLGNDLFAADINDVERVLRYAVPTPVPNVPPWVQGVIEYRSHVVPVVDLRLRFELPASPPDGATRIMVLASGGEWIATVVDAVLEVVPIGNVPLAPPPSLFSGMAADFLKGILRRNEKLIIVLDVTRLLATRDRLAFDSAVLVTADAAAIAPPAVASPAGPSPAHAPLGGGSPPHASPGIASPVHASPEEGSPEDGSPLEKSPASADDTAPAMLPDSGGVSRTTIGDLTIIRGSADPAQDDLLQLVGTSDEPPTPDDSVLRGGPAIPPSPEWGTQSPPRAVSGSADDEGTGHSDG